MQKRKLSDMLGNQWSKEELERFYEAYRKYGKDWRKVCLYCSLNLLCFWEGFFVIYVVLHQCCDYWTNELLLFGFCQNACYVGWMTCTGVPFLFFKLWSIKSSACSNNLIKVLPLLGYQVAGAVRNRSSEMVEALYNLNRVKCIFLIWYFIRWICATFS